MVTGVGTKSFGLDTGMLQVCACSTILTIKATLIKTQNIRITTEVGGVKNKSETHRCSPSAWHENVVFDRSLRSSQSAPAEEKHSKVGDETHFGAPGS